MLNIIPTIWSLFTTNAASPSASARILKSIMTQSLFATRSMVETSQDALIIALEKICKGQSCWKFSESTEMSPLKFPKSILQRWSKRKNPQIGRNRDGAYFITSRRSTVSKAWNAQEKQETVDLVVNNLIIQHIMSSEEVRTIVCNYRDEKKDAGTASIQLIQAKFSHSWLRRFLAVDSNKSSFNVARSVDQLRIRCFNSDTVSHFCASGIGLRKLWHQFCRQVYNLDETGFLPGRDLVWRRGKQFIRSVGNRGTWPRVNFQ